MPRAMLYFKPLKGITNPLQVERLASSISNNVELLTITSTFLEVSFRNLKELQLIMENPSYCNAGDIASFLKNCPRLEKLFIDADEFTFDGGAFYELHQRPLLDKHSALFKHLKLIKIMGFRFQPCHLDLTRFLLGKPCHWNICFFFSPKVSVSVGLCVRIWTFSPMLFSLGNYLPTQKYL
ncbi:FBD, F-box and Leucine Rich Repeat domains containing protein [Prunus dulcis]|uniref:FBD, F-box and Leucine Rich Repeat domains containing protein n=1 Tax=Prunus dulcis TaxID=3755 RepID=A0A4Y1R9H7_PRUDU|nr:FBD, F-box and Leucine Rich Repeat domains containing protein [Prunus dulcis]